MVKKIFLYFLVTIFLAVSSFGLFNTSLECLPDTCDASFNCIRNLTNGTTYWTKGSNTQHSFFFSNPGGDNFYGTGADGTGVGTTLSVELSYQQSTTSSINNFVGLTKDGSADNDVAMFLRPGGGGAGMWSIYDGGAWKNNKSFSANTWYRLKFVMSARNITLYVNGQITNLINESQRKGAPIHDSLDELRWKHDNPGTSKIANISIFNGTGCVAMGGAPTPIYNFTITAKNNLTTTNLSAFSVDIGGSSYSTTNGRINTTILTNDTTLYDLNGTSTGYYPLFLYNLNMSNASIDLQFTPIYEFTARARDKLYNTNLTIFNLTLNGTLYTTTTGIINTSMPTANEDLWSILVTAPGYNPRTYANYNISLNENTTSLLANLTNTRLRLNVTARQKLNSSASISNFTVTLLSLNSSETLIYNTATKSIIAWGLWNETYNVTIVAPDYSLNQTQYKFNQILGNLTIDLWPLNSISVTIYDEKTLAKITENITIQLISDSFSDLYTTMNGTYVIENLTVNNYRLDFSGANYTLRTFYANIVQQTHIFLDAWLLKTADGANIKINIKDTLGNFIEDVDVTVTKNMAGSYVTIAQKNTGVAGYVNIFLDQTINYRFLISATGYTTRVIDLEPTETEYTIILRDETEITFESFLYDISYSITPVTNLLLPINVQNFSLTVSSPSGLLSNFGVKSGGTITNVTGSVAGGVATISLNTSLLDRTSVSVVYFFELNTGNGLFINKTFFIGITNTTDTSLQGIADTYGSGINPLYRLLIALFVSVLAGLVLFVYVGPVGAGMISFFVFAGFGIMGFVNWLYPVILGVVVIGGYLATGGLEP